MARSGIESRPGGFSSAENAPQVMNGVDEIVLTPEGRATLQAEYQHLVAVKRAEAREELRRALEAGGDPGADRQYLDAQAELDGVEERIALLEHRLAGARVLAPGEVSDQTVSLGSRVLLEDLDDGEREEYVLVSPYESKPSEGRLSNESPVGTAISGHGVGDVVEVAVPHGLRQLRIAGLRRSPAGSSRARRPVPREVLGADRRRRAGAWRSDR